VNLRLQPAGSLEQLEAIRSGRLDAGFANFMPKVDADLDQLIVGWQQVELALPKRNPLTRLKKLRLRDLTDAPFIWFPRRASPAFYDRLMHECYRGGLKSPRIVQEGPNEATILSLVSTGLGVGWVLGSARWRCPQTVVVWPVVDLTCPCRSPSHGDGTIPPPCSHALSIRYGACERCERSIKAELLAPRPPSGLAENVLRAPIPAPLRSVRALRTSETRKEQTTAESPLASSGTCVDIAGITLTVRN
jgi:LysR substrate binding domain-containing protein